MTESTNSQRVDFGVKTTALIHAATQLVIIGTAQLKTSKVLALAAVMQGAPTEDVSKKTGVAEATLKRIAAVARGKQASVISERLRAVDFASLVATGDDYVTDAAYDATIDAANVWDDFFVEQSKSKSREPMTATDLAIMVHDNIVAHADDAAVWIAAVEDALASALATIEEGESEEAAA